MQINRMFEIIYILMNKKRVTAKALAEHFGVSQRTIYRDVDTLSLAGIPIYTEKGKGGGICLLPDFVLNKSLLSEEEQFEILSALQGLISFKTEDTHQVLSKLTTVFNKNAAKWLEVDFSEWGDWDNGAFHTLKHAILQRRIVEFDYFSTFGEHTRRRMEPIQLWFKSKAWYVKGYCLTREDIRLFKLIRMKNLTVTDESFAQRDLLAIEPKDAPADHQKQDVAFKFKIAPEKAYRVFDEFGGACVKQQADGSFVVSVTWPEDAWVYGLILSFGEHLEVLEPEHIREIIKQKALQTAALYGQCAQR